jgi:hypothetical protein
MNNKIFVSIFICLSMFVFLPQTVAVSNSKIVYESGVADFSVEGIDLVEKNGKFVPACLIDLQLGDMVIFDTSDESLARKVVSINRYANKMIINTQQPDFYEVMDSYELPEQNIEIQLDGNTVEGRGKIFDKTLSINKSYSDKIGKVSFNTELKATLDVNANIDIPITKKNGVVKLESKFTLGLQNTRLKTEITKEYNSGKIKLADFNEKNSVLKIYTQIVTQTISTGGINAELDLSAEVVGAVTASAELKRKWFVPVPTKCGVSNSFDINVNEAFNVSTSKLTNLQQQIGIEFEFSCLGINIATFSSQVAPYARANGKIESALSFKVDKDFKPSLTRSPGQVLNAECELGINSDTSVSLIKNLYKKDFGEKSLVVYRCAGNK